MGKKSRFKKQKSQLNGDNKISNNFSEEAELHNPKESRFSLEKVLKLFIKIGLYSTCLTPFIIFNQFYFPFVGTKSLFFMACCELVFFSWIILAFANKEYRPKLNNILVAASLFLAAMFVSSIIGVDFSQSFWSKFERMTGLLMWLHMFGFFLAISSSIKTLKEWKNFFLVSVFISSLIAFLSTFEVIATKNLSLISKSFSDIKGNFLYVALKGLIIADRGGLTLGNTSFLGTYLGFNFFLAIYLFFNSAKFAFKKNHKLIIAGGFFLLFLAGLLLFNQDYRILQNDLSAFARNANPIRNLVMAFAGIFGIILIFLGKKAFSVLAIFLFIISLLFNEARAAFLSVIFGAGILLLLWFSFIDLDNRNYRKQSRLIGIGLASSLVIGAISAMLFFRGLLDKILNYFNSNNLVWALYLFIALLVALIVWLILRFANEDSFRKITSIVSKLILVLVLLTTIASLILLFLPNNPVHNIFGKMGGTARFVNWDIAWNGFIERPILGWGPENYILVFPKFFNTCLFLDECGGEIWFDRSHNIIFDNLITSGLVGTVLYLGIFLVCFIFLFRKYFKQKEIGFWEFSILSLGLLAYFIQNLTVFDMATSLMMFSVFLAFGAFLLQRGKKIDNGANYQSGKISIGIAALFIVCFGLSFLLFVYQPLKTDNGVILAMVRDQEVNQYARSLKDSNFVTQENTLTKQYEDGFVNFANSKANEKLDLMKKTLGDSPSGKYQIREFFAQQFESFMREPVYENYFVLSNEAKLKIYNNSIDTFDYLLSQLEKTMQESPNDYRTALRLGSLYSFYSKIDPRKYDASERALSNAVLLSPDNQQTYWLLAQNRFWRAMYLFREEKAPKDAVNKKIEEAIFFAKKSKDLNEKVWNSAGLVLYVLKSSRDLANEMGDRELYLKYNGMLQKEIEDDLKINPSWEQEIERFK